MTPCRCGQCWPASEAELLVRLYGWFSLNAWLLWTPPRPRVES